MRSTGKFLTYFAAVSFCLIVAMGCATKGPYVPKAESPTVEDTNAAVIYDPGLVKWIAVDKTYAEQLSDGRAKVLASIRNRQNKPITVQVQTVFKSEKGFSTGDETAWQTLIFSPNETKTYETASFNSAATRYTIRIRFAQ